jgi:hypothetical protein
MFFETLPSIRSVSLRVVCVGAMLCLVAAARAEYPPLAVEISPAHPLMMFQDLPAYRSDPERQREHLLTAWEQLPDTIRSQSVLKLAVPGKGDRMKGNYDAVLPVLQEPQIPTVIRIANFPLRDRMTPAALEELLRAHTMVRGVEVRGLDFRYYDSPRLRDGQTPEIVDWLIAIIDTSARYGRFVYIPLEDLQWVRIMSNRACRPLYEKLLVCKDYVIPACLTRGDHVVGNQSAVMGLWLEGAVSNWGMAADARWYSDNNFVSPGVFGDAGGTGEAPRTLYRAMILNGAMTGATVYSFEHGPDLWYGPARFHWDEGIYPMLREVVPQALACRKDLILRRARVALQLVEAGDPETFHLNLRDIDGVLDDGNLLRAAYGLRRPGQLAELIPNRGDHYWIPFLSAHASQESQAQFDQVISAGTLSTEAAWAEALTPYRDRSTSGEAFVARVGHNVFVMNTSENLQEAQPYTVNELAAPVRGFEARREGDAVVVTWGFRENDVEYRVYRRVEPEPGFVQLSGPLEQESQRFTDTSAPKDKTVAYAVTAVTDEREPFSGVVEYGGYHAFSVAESRIAEEVVLTDVLGRATSAPIEAPALDATIVAPWWPDYAGVTEAQMPAAKAIVEQIELWDDSLVAEKLNGIMAVYGTDYADPEGWGFQYVRRAYQWLLERYRAVKMHRQIRTWDFANVDSTGQVNVLLYLRLSAVALTDSSGLRADVTVSIPRTPAAQVWTTWTEAEGVWRMVRTNPAMPNFRELLSFEAGPYDNFPLGPDRF